MQILGEGGVPCGAVLNAEDIHKDSHLLEPLTLTAHLATYSRPRIWTARAGRGTDGGSRPSAYSV